MTIRILLLINSLDVKFNIIKKCPLEKTGRALLFKEKSIMESDKRKKWQWETVKHEVRTRLYVSDIMKIDNLIGDKKNNSRSRVIRDLVHEALLNK